MSQNHMTIYIKIIYNFIQCSYRIFPGEYNNTNDIPTSMLNNGSCNYLSIIIAIIDHSHSSDIEIKQTLKSKINRRLVFVWLSFVGQYKVKLRFHAYFTIILYKNRQTSFIYNVKIKTRARQHYELYLKHQFPTTDHCFTYIEK